MAAEKKELTCGLVEMPPSLIVGGLELVPWLVESEAIPEGKKIVVYDLPEAKTNSGRNYLSLLTIITKGNIPVLHFFPSQNEFGKKIGPCLDKKGQSELIMDLHGTGRKWLEWVSLPDMPGLSGFGHLWFQDERGVVEVLKYRQLPVNVKDLAFVPIPEVGKAGSGGVLVTESDLLRDPWVQETLKNFLGNREFKIK